MTSLRRQLRWQEHLGLELYESCSEALGPAQQSEVLTMLPGQTTVRASCTKETPTSASADNLYSTPRFITRRSAPAGERLQWQLPVYELANDSQRLETNPPGASSL